MKKTLIALFIMVYFTNVLGTDNELYNKKMDSLLVVLGEKIEINLSCDGYKLPKRTFRDVTIVGWNFVLEVSFIPKSSYILLYDNVSETMMRKFLNQNKSIKLRKHAYFSAFRNYIQEFEKLPFEIVDYISYKFITPYDDSPSDYVIYGEYKFKVIDENEEFEISEKKIEILKGKDEILNKYHSEF